MVTKGLPPPGLLFASCTRGISTMLYGEIMEYEMSLLRWPPQKLIPCHLEERNRKQALIDFSARWCFEHPD